MVTFDFFFKHKYAAVSLSQSGLKAAECRAEPNRPDGILISKTRYLVVSMGRMCPKTDVCVCDSYHVDW